MNEWEARYKFLLMGIDNQEYIENAEKAYRACVVMAQSTPFTFVQCVYALIDLMNAETLKALNELPKDIK